MLIVSDHHIAAFVCPDCKVETWPGEIETHNRTCPRKMRDHDFADVADELAEAAAEARAVFPDSTWQHSRQAADAADGLDEKLRRYREQRARYERQFFGTPKPSVPRTTQGTWNA